MKQENKSNIQTDETIIKKTVNNLIIVGAVAFATAMMLSEYFIKKLIDKDEYH